MAISVISHPRIDDGIKDIDEEIEDYGEYRDHHDRTHDERVVAVERCIDEIAAATC